VSTIKTRTVSRRNRLSSNANETIVVERTVGRRNRLASNANETIVAS
jgi:hypothetical protein